MRDRVYLYGDRSPTPQGTDFESAGAAVLIGMLMLLQQYIKNRASWTGGETILLNQPQVNFEDMEGGEEVSFDPSTERDLTGIAVIGVAAVLSFWQVMPGGNRAEQAKAVSGTRKTGC